MPKIRRNKNDRLRIAFANGIKSQANAHGVSVAQLKHSGSKSYATTNNRLEINPGEITINDLICFSIATHTPFEELITKAAQIASEATKY